MSTGSRSSPSRWSRSSRSAQPDVERQNHQPPRRHDEAGREDRGGTLDPQVNYTLQYWKLYLATYDGLLALRQGGRRRGLRGSCRTWRRQKIPPRMAARPGTLKPARGSSSRTARRSPSTTSSRRFSGSSRSGARLSGGFYSGIVGASKCLKTPATCTLTGGVSANAATHRDDRPHGARPRVQVQARRAPRLHPSRELPAERCGHEAGSWHRGVLLRVVQPEQAARDEAEPVLQGVVEAREAGRRSGPDPGIVRADGRGADHRGRERPGGLDARRPRPRIVSPEIGTKYAGADARQRADGVLVRADEHEPGAVHQPEGAPSGELCDRSERDGQDLRRTEAGGPVVPGAASRLPRVQGDCPYTKNPGTKWSTPDLAKAKKLVNESGQKGAKVVVISPDDEVEKAVGVYLASVLDRDRVQGDSRRRSPGTSPSPTSRTRRTRCRSTSSSGIRTIRPPRTSCTSSSAVSRSTPAVTRASTSRASATSRSTPRCTRRSSSAGRTSRRRTCCGRRSTAR